MLQRRSTGMTPHRATRPLSCQSSSPRAPSHLSYPLWVLTLVIWVVIVPKSNSALPPRDPFDQWQMENLMTRPRGALAAVLWRNHIYAIGGHDGSSVQSSVEFAAVNS